MPKAPLEYLKHILDECNYLMSVGVSLQTQEDLMADETLKRAVVRSLEIIGEASKKVPADWKVRWSEIKWKNMAGMRDRLIHEYMGINYSIVWDVIMNKIPELQSQIKGILDTER